MAPQATAVSARAVLAGDPTALALLARLRGPAVLAYCEKVCGKPASLEAASAAFAAFRTSAMEADDPLAMSPEQLLLAHTRRAAAASAAHGRRGPGFRECHNTPEFLAAVAAAEIDEEDHQKLRHHLGRCTECRRAQTAQLAAERAYHSPRRAPLAGTAEVAIVAAMRSVVVPSDDDTAEDEAQQIGAAAVVVPETQTEDFAAPAVEVPATNGASHAAAVPAAESAPRAPRVPASPVQIRIGGNLGRFVVRHARATATVLATLAVVVVLAFAGTFSSVGSMPIQSTPLPQPQTLQQPGVQP